MQRGRLSNLKAGPKTRTFQILQFHRPAKFQKDILGDISQLNFEKQRDLKRTNLIEKVYQTNIYTMSSFHKKQFVFNTRRQERKGGKNERKEEEKGTEQERKKEKKERRVTLVE